MGSRSPLLRVSSGATFMTDATSPMAPRTSAKILLQMAQFYAAADASRMESMAKAIKAPGLIVPGLLSTM